ncbi:hypothetical protein HBN50_05310 [Halobacteriovorax sp. GB3]|uniref:hypothetical protein n=1 Tax=Halobacteriovorax sp. GB3 TaxID=2719615 RepID=UPI00235E5E20|nr:hypothetical protein [Halobacteriovorax sp. GB3]MDD0852504.1 hypothetical protein [Halobacteriovorax sp. GB3]
MIKLQNLSIFFALLILSLFATTILRSHHFLNSKKYQYATSDGVLMLNHQSMIQKSNNEEVLGEFQVARNGLRPMTEKNFFEFIIGLSKKLNISSYQGSKIFATSIFFLALMSITLGAFILSNSLLLAGTLLIFTTQSPYFNWMRYQTFCPKMWGFSFFPIIFLLFLKIIEDFSSKTVRDSKVSLIAFFTLFALASTFYPASVAYYVPAMLFAGLVLIIIKESFNIRNILSKSEHKRVLLFFTFLSLSFLVFFLTKEKPHGLIGPPPKEITELVYNNHKLTYNRFLEYVQNTYFYLIVSIFMIFDFHFRRRTSFRNIAIFFLTFSLAVIAESIATQYMANFNDFIRMIWPWRSYYFGYFSFSCICALWVYDRFSLQITQAKGLLKYASATIIFVIAFNHYTFTSAGQLIKNIAPHYTNKNLVTAESIEFENMKNVIDFAKRQPAASIFVMPRRGAYTLFDSIFEIETNQIAIMGDLERTLFIGMTNKTKKYYNFLYRFKSIYNHPQKNYENKIIELAKDLNSKFVIIDNKFLEKNKIELKGPIAFKDEIWTILTY